MKSPLLTLFLILNLLACEEQPVTIPDPIIQVETTRHLQGYPIHFTAELPANVNLDDLDFIWGFTDGQTARGIEVSHIYSEPGTYQVVLTIIGEKSSKSNSNMITIEPSLELIESYSLDVDEPSGLSFGLDNRTLWTVSDKSGQVVHLDLQGNTLGSLAYQGTDLEGISFDTRDSTLWLVSENQATLIHIDTNGVELGSQWIAGVSDGSGLEGIALDPVHSRIFMIKEKDFSALLILDDSLETQTYQRIGFAPDYSGLYYSNMNDKLWMLSHEASSIYLTDTSGTLLETYAFFMEQPEGVVFDEVDSIFYIVDDATEKLHLYSFWE
ncbi:MAG: SdiA-regulated domain-containing protein [Candidatus Marinimicrobia bacterium]|nr:SdiA-regulated domain-containing protein [Candidatus Neomarinimicrobiota bacterium]